MWKGKGDTESVARGPTSSPWQDTAFCCTLPRTAGTLEDKLLFQYCFCVPTAMLRWYQHPCWQHLCLAKPSPLPDVSFRLSAWFLLNLKETLFSHISVSTAFLAPSVLRHRGVDFALETWQPKSGLFPISLFPLRSKCISFEIAGSMQPSLLAFTSCRCFEILTSVNWEKTNKKPKKPCKCRSYAGQFQGGRGSGSWLTRHVSKPSLELKQTPFILHACWKLHSQWKESNILITACSATGENRESPTRCLENKQPPNNWSVTASTETVYYREKYRWKKITRDVQNTFI